MKSPSVVLIARCVGLLLATAQVAGAAPREVPLTIDTKILADGGALWGRLPFYNDTVALSPERPADVRKIPTPNGTLLFGRIRLGNGPRGTHLLAVDQGPDAQPELRRLYIDANQNGDLTDDGDGKWEKAISRGKFVANTSSPTLRVSYGTESTETASAAYSLLFIYSIPRPDAGYTLSYRRAGAMVGQLEIAGKPVRLALIENENDARFDKQTPAGNNPRPFWLLADLDGDGQYDPYTERFDARQPIKLGETTYEVSTPVDGTRLTFSTTTKVAQAPGKRPEPRAATPRVPLLAVGTVAPDFTAYTKDNQPVKLSDLRGKVVLIDFWATWCGPCKASMPYLESLHQKAGSQNFALLGVCVWDTRAAFDKWMLEPEVKTTYLKVFDPAGRGDDNIAKKLYNVSGIPTFYVIGRDGSVVGSFVGNSPENKEKLAALLAKEGIAL